MTVSCHRTHLIFFIEWEENRRVPRLVVVSNDHTGDTMGYRH